jgi:pyridoxal phosphate enzyme (YggS family)
MMESLASRFQQVTSTLAALAEELQLPRGLPHLVAVTKTVPPSVIAEAYSLGHRRFGENYVHEICDKAPQLPLDIEWHYIGTLQSNKVKTLLFGVPNLFCVESVNSAKLASLLDKTWASKEPRPALPLNVFVQVNTSNEESKDGVAPTIECRSLVEHIIGKCPNLAFRGLMTIGAPGDVSCFDLLVQVRDSLCTELHLPYSLELSMGMSGDYEAAVRRGATSVRVGSLLFGPRPVVKQTR